MLAINDDLKKILDISISLTGEQDYYSLLDDIIEVAMDITNCDGGTLYLHTDEGLKFMIMRTVSMGVYKGGSGEEIGLPVVPLKESNVCAYCLIHGEHINIPDVYSSQLFDFTGPRNYDAITGYKTTSMLVLPLISHEGDTLGVLQLINAMDSKGNVIPFAPEVEYVVFSLASQACMSLGNMEHIREMRVLIDSVISAFTRAIDERTPYNANHTASVAGYVEGFIDYINDLHKDGRTEYYFSDEDRDQTVMASRLHDVGKLIVPTSVMNKANRLTPEDMRAVMDRFRYVELLYRLEQARGELTEEECGSKISGLQDMAAFIREADQAGFLPDEKIERVESIASIVYRDVDGEDKPLLLPEEARMLHIRKGTLAPEEREIMESHVVYTDRILREIHFGKRLEKVPGIAAAHHEFLDGTGYPQKTTAENIPISVRVVTIADIFDSLCAADRPYKKPMPKDRAISILKEMVTEGKLDGGLVELFEGYALGGEN